MLIGNFYGTEAFAAYNIGVNLLMVCMTVGFGFSIAGSTLVGQHLGANDHAAATRSGWRSMGLPCSPWGLGAGDHFSPARWRPSSWATSRSPSSTRCSSFTCSAR
jgi:hypothetical protein